MKCFSVINKNDLLALHMQNQLRFAPFDGAYFAGHGDEITIGTIERGAAIDSGECSIAAGHFNDLDMAMQVEQDKVCGMNGAIFVTNHRIELIGARIAITQVILHIRPPRAETDNSQDEEDHDEHATHDIEPG